MASAAKNSRKIVELPLGLHLMAHEGRPRHLDGGLRAAGDGRRVVDDPFDDELARQRGDGEIEPLDPQARDADDGADQRRHQAAGRQRDPERQVEVHGQIGGRVGADRHEGRVADRDLAGVADQDVQAERADDGDQGQVDDGEVVLVQRQRQHDREQHDDRSHRPARDRQRIERHVGGVAGLEHSGLAMQHGAVTPARSCACRKCRRA